MTIRQARHGKLLERWFAAGEPIRDRRRVREILAEHCGPCTALDRQFRYCMVLGCGRMPKRRLLRRFVLLGTTTCVLRKWK
jgi:hypothetical protein